MKLWIMMTRPVLVCQQHMQIKPYSKNAKKHPAKQIEQVAASIREFGMNQPIVVDAQGVIIVDHGRYEALKSLNWSDEEIAKHVKVVDLSEEQAKAYRLADNKLNESEWDMELVISDLKELTDALIDLTGFDKDLILEPEDIDDEVPETPEEPQSEFGDLYELGEHRIMCGDSTKAECLERLMNGNKADMVFTDPPYNVNYSGSGENTSEGIMNDHMSEEDFDTFLTEAFKRYAEHSKGGAGWYVFHSHHAQDAFRRAIDKTDWKVKSQLIWNKPSAGLGMNEYRPKHEPFFYCVNNEAVFYGDRTGTTVWDLHKSEQALIAWAKKQKRLETEGKTTIWTMKRENVGGYVHPTQKPVELITYALHNSSKAGDIVLDTFLGSGSTLIAAQKTGRVCYGMELDPKYIDVIVSRYVAYTKNSTVIKNGEEITWQDPQ